VHGTNTIISVLSSKHSARLLEAESLVIWYPFS